MSDLPDKIRETVNKSLRLKSTDKIIDFLQNGNIKLTMTEHTMLERFDVIDNLIRDGKTPAFIARVMKGKFQVSTAQTYRDIADTKEIYGSIRTIDKNYYLNFLLESMIQSIKMAKDEGPARLKEKNMAEKNMLALLALIEDKETTATMKNIIINITSDPETIGLKRIENIEDKIAKYMKKTKSIKIDAEEANVINDE
jgi:hypothetical protein